MVRSAQLVGAVLSVLLLLLPALQAVTGLAPSAPLGGVEIPAKQIPEATFAAFCDGSLQEGIESNFAHDLGLRDWIVRLDNELRFAVFGATKRPVVAGRDQWLFEEAYMPARALSHGFEFNDLLLRMANFLLLQQLLEERGICLILCVSPSKGATYPEQLPLDHRLVRAAMADDGRETLYDVARRAIDIGKLRCVDFARRFREWRSTDAPGTPQLFTRGGTHWSNHAAARAAIELIDAAESALKSDIANLDIVGTRLAPAPIEDEDDLVRMANVLCESRFRDATAQPVVARRAGDQGTPAGMLLVGTSFVWGLTRTLGQTGAVAPLTVWYYFNSSTEFRETTPSARQPLDAEKKDLAAAIGRYRIVVVECNEVGLVGLGHGFLEAALKAHGREPIKSLDALPPELVERLRR